MNIQQIKQRLDLEKLLNLIGAESDPGKSRGADIWYKSPFRPNETEPSFHINTKYDIYKDFGSGEEGGDLIHFAQAFLRSLGRGDTIKEALDWLRELTGNKIAHTTPSKAANKFKSDYTVEYEIIQNAELFITSLLTHLSSRDINQEVAKHHLRQIKFVRPPSTKEIFGYGFKNQSGGFDFSNPLGFKTALGNKDLSLIKGVDESQIDVFEGKMDLLTLLTLQEVLRPKNDVIVLNSTHLHKAASSLIHTKGYRYVRLWLDNDKSGDYAKRSIQEALKFNSCQITSMSEIYSEFKDLNQWHTDSNLTFGEKQRLINLNIPEVVKLEVSSSPSYE